MKLLDRWLAKIIVTDKGLPPTAAGIQYHNEIRIRPEAINDVGLIAHERIHVLQWQLCIVALMALSFVFGVLASPMYPVLAGVLLALLSIPTGEQVHGWLYRSFVWYRLRAEVLAFRVQLRHYPERTESIAEWLASERSGYRFPITVDRARELLRGSE